MHLLYLSEPYPWPLINGGNMRHYHIIRQLAMRHQVTLVTMHHEEFHTDLGTPPSPYEKICHRVITTNGNSMISQKVRRRFHHFGYLDDRIKNLYSWWRSHYAALWTSPKVVQYLGNVLDDVQPDVVWADQSYLAETAWASGFRRIVADVDDILWVYRYKQLRQQGWYKSKPIHYFEMAKTAYYELTLPRWIWRIVIAKEEDRKYLSANPARVYLVPNGMEPNEPCDPAAEVPGQMLFTGTMDYPPNIDAVLHFTTDIFPLIQKHIPNSTFHVVGSKPEPEVRTLHDGKSVFIYGTVPSMAPYYPPASLFVSPLRMGAGTKLKILDALSRNKAVVASPESVAGLDLQHGVHLEVAEKPEEFAAACVRLLQDPQRRQQLAAAGRAKVIAQYSWDRIGEMAHRAVQLP